MVLEICLIIIGAVLVILSFVLSEKLISKDKAVFSAENIDIGSIAGDEIREKVDIEVDNIIDEKTEKFDLELDKISNEKIMAMGDYSQSILDEIKKNHNEVLFLYNMLNDKETDIKNLFIDVENLKKSVKAEKNLEENKAVINNQFEQSFIDKAENELKAANYSNKVSKLKAEKESEIENESKAESKSPLKNEPKTQNEIKKESKTESKRRTEKKVQIESESKEIIGPVENVQQEEIDSETEKNNNDRILELMKQGKSNVQIAKELGLGVGEVRLVVDLFK